MWLTFQNHWSKIKDPYNNWRLPTNQDGQVIAVPSHYDVDLELPGRVKVSKLQYYTVYDLKWPWKINFRTYD